MSRDPHMASPSASATKVGQGCTAQLRREFAETSSKPPARATGWRSRPTFAIPREPSHPATAGGRPLAARQIGSPGPGGQGGGAHPQGRDGGVARGPPLRRGPLRLGLGSSWRVFVCGRPGDVRCGAAA